MSDMIERKAAMELRDSLADIICARPMSSIHSALSEYRKAIAALPAQPAQEEAVARKTFPILNGNGARIDWQLVADHGGQAQKNHYQTVAQLGGRGGLSWCELYAVLHNKPWQKIDTNEAMIACRALEARYLAAIAPTPPDSAEFDALVAEARERARDEFAAGHMNDAVFHGNVADAITALRAKWVR